MRSSTRTLRWTAAAFRARLFERIDAMPPRKRIEAILEPYLSPRRRDSNAEGCPLPAVVGEIGTAASEHALVLREEIDALALAQAPYLPTTPRLAPRHLALGAAGSNKRRAS